MSRRPSSRGSTIEHEGSLSGGSRDSYSSKVLRHVSRERAEAPREGHSIDGCSSISAAALAEHYAISQVASSACACPQLHLHSRTYHPMRFGMEPAGAAMCCPLEHGTLRSHWHAASAPAISPSAGARPSLQPAPASQEPACIAMTASLAAEHPTSTSAARAQRINRAYGLPCACLQRSCTRQGQ